MKKAEWSIEDKPGRNSWKLVQLLFWLVEVWMSESTVNRCSGSPKAGRKGEVIYESNCIDKEALREL
jgi:hypothetical protein